MQHWFERKFNFDLPVLLFPNVLERLRGSPARLEERVRFILPAVRTARFQDTWSIQENVGHLRDLEPLWIRRAEQLLAGEGELAVADLTNRGTDEAHHNAAPLESLLDEFRSLRFRLLSILEGADASALERTARHPRLGTPMRLIDIAFFTAEHDDHHMARITELLRMSQR
ncbi:MAG: DinB family protein [Spirochaetia bacterium]